MAVTITRTDFMAALRLGPSAEETDFARRLLDYATLAVEKHAPGAPEAVQNEAVIRLGGYLFDQPSASRNLGYANALKNSGAASMLLAYRVHRAGSVAGAEAAGTAGETPASGGLDQAQVDARVQAGVEDWAETGNTDAIPAAKLANAISTDPIGTDDLADGAVTSAKLAANAVLARNIAPDQVGLDQLAGGTAGRFLGFDDDGNPAEIAAPGGGGINAPDQVGAAASLSGGSFAFDSTTRTAFRDAWNDGSARLFVIVLANADNRTYWSFPLWRVGLPPSASGNWFAVSLVAGQWFSDAESDFRLEDDRRGSTDELILTGFDSDFFAGLGAVTATIQAVT